jgi:hypothetical protein
LIARARLVSNRLFALKNLAVCASYSVIAVGYGKIILCCDLFSGGFC